MLSSQGGNLLRDLSPDHTCILDHLHFQQNELQGQYLQTTYWVSPYVRSSKHGNVTRSKKTELLGLIIEYVTSKDFQKLQQAGLIPATVLQSLGFLESDLEAPTISVSVKITGTFIGSNS
jgi:hypothetical protein